MRGQRCPRPASWQSSGSDGQTCDRVLAPQRACARSLACPQSADPAERSKAKAANPYASVDPAPPLPEDASVELLRSTLLDEKQPLFVRYQAMFSLRNVGTEEAVLVRSMHAQVQALERIAGLPAHAGTCRPCAMASKHPAHCSATRLRMCWGRCSTPRQQRR